MSYVCFPLPPSISASLQNQIRQIIDTLRIDFSEEAGDSHDNGKYAHKIYGFLRPFATGTLQSLKCLSVVQDEMPLVTFLFSVHNIDMDTVIEPNGWLVFGWCLAGVW